MLEEGSTYFDFGNVHFIFVTMCNYRFSKHNHRLRSPEPNITGACFGVDMTKRMATKVWRPKQARCVPNTVLPSPQTLTTMTAITKTSPDVFFLLYFV